MDLMHNSVFKILTGQNTGLYRVVLDEIPRGMTLIVRLDPPEGRTRRGRKRLNTTKSKRKKPPAPLIGKLIFADRDGLQSLHEKNQLMRVEVEPESFPLSTADEAQFDRRCNIMKGFLDFDNLREKILVCRDISGLVDEAVANSDVSRPLIYKLFSALCRFGFVKSSLRPRHDRCGARGTLRPCDPGGRQKAGAKTTKQRVARAHGQTLPPQQPGMSSEWRARIMAADRQIKTPKPAMPARIIQILGSAFVKKYRQNGNELIAVDPALGEYPNNRQIRRTLETEMTKLQRLLDKTTKGHFARSNRGMTGKNWEGVSGPGHTWAIDSTVGDIYLRSSVNRAWIIGRPIVYILVDVWSTAILGFYVCLMGPSWDMAKISLFSAVVPPELLGELWGYQPMLTLNPAPTMPAALMCDRGEYLSKAASVTGANLIPCLSYAPPYRPDLKGLVAEGIINNIRKTIIRDQLTDPKFYEGMSKLLADLIKQSRDDAAAYEEFLKKAEALVRQMAQKSGGAFPAVLQGHAEAIALYNNLDSIPASNFQCPTSDEDKAALAVRLNWVVRESAPAGWRGDDAREAQLLNALYPVMDRDREATKAIFEIIKNQPGY